MPVIHSLEKTMEQRITEYYGGASIYRPNKFLVGLYGEHVNKAINTLLADCETERSPSAQYNGNKKMSHNTQVYKNALLTWMSKYFNDEDNQVELKWTCSNVSIPTVKSNIDPKAVRLDNHKTIKYPLVKAADNSGEIKLTIVEDRNMMMFQFFNALQNQSYIPQIMKPKSTFHKLGMYVAALQEDFVLPTTTTEGGYVRDFDLDSVVSQVFEFNSITIIGLSGINFANDAKDKLTYEVTFAAPNLFQGAFKTSFKGLRNTGSDAEYLKSIVDASMMTSASKYKIEQFELTKDELNSTGNGIYPDQW